MLDPHRTVSDALGGRTAAHRNRPRPAARPETADRRNGPTSVLTPQEVEQLFIVLRQLAKEGCSILYISHKLHEIKALCDFGDDPARRQARRYLRSPSRRHSRSMAEKMIGGSLKTISPPSCEPRLRGPPRFVVNRLSMAGIGHFGIALRDMSPSVRAGEIFGIAGVAGNGQTALLLALSGEETVEDGEDDHARWRPISDSLNAKSAAAQWARECSRGAERSRRSARLHALGPIPF